MRALNIWLFTLQIMSIFTNIGYFDAHIKLLVKHGVCFTFSEQLFWQNFNEKLPKFMDWLVWKLNFVIYVLTQLSDIYRCSVFLNLFLPISIKHLPQLFAQILLAAGLQGFIFFIHEERRDGFDCYETLKYCLNLSTLRPIDHPQNALICFQLLKRDLLILLDSFAETA